MSLENRVKEVDLESILISKVNELKRYALVWEWIEENQHGKYIKYDDIVKLIATEFSGIFIKKERKD